MTGGRPPQSRRSGPGGDQSRDRRRAAPFLDVADDCAAHLQCMISDARRIRCGRPHAPVLHRSPRGSYASKGTRRRDGERGHRVALTHAEGGRGYRFCPKTWRLAPAKEAVAGRRPRSVRFRRPASRHCARDAECATAKRRSRDRVVGDADCRFRPGCCALSSATRLRRDPTMAKA